MHRSAVAAVSLVALMSIASCGSFGDQTLEGELTDQLFDRGDWPMNELDARVAEYESEPCQGMRSFSAGDEVLVRNGEDAIVGKANLQAGRPAMAIYTTSRVDVVPWYQGGELTTKRVTVNSVSSAVRSCTMPFTIDLKPADFYTIYVDGVKGPTWTAEELDRLGWMVLLGDEPVTSGVFGDGVHNATTTTTTTKPTTTTTAKPTTTTTTAKPTTTAGVVQDAIAVDATSVSCTDSSIEIHAVIQNVSDASVSIDNVAFFPGGGFGHSFHDFDNWWPLPVLGPGETAVHDDVLAIETSKPGEEMEFMVSWSSGDQFGQSSLYLGC